MLNSRSRKHEEEAQSGKVVRPLVEPFSGVKPLICRLVAYLGADQHKLDIPPAALSPPARDLKILTFDLRPLQSGRVVG